MLLDNSELYRLAASLAGIIHKKVERHGGVVSSVVEVGRNTAQNYLQENLWKCLPACQAPWPYE